MIIKAPQFGQNRYSNLRYKVTSRSRDPNNRSFNIKPKNIESNFNIAEKLNIEEFNRIDQEIA